MKKILSLFVLLVAIVTGAWAGTETPGNSGSKDTQLTGTSYSIGGDYIAGAGSTKTGDMETKGVKIRTNKNSNTLVISVNEGYRIDGLTIYGVSNDSKKAVEVSGVSIDGVAQTFTSVTFPNKNSTESATIALTDIAATNDITLSFGTNAGTQLNLDLHFTYTQTQVITQEVTGVTLNGSAISDTDLATLKSTKALTINGSSLNGLGTLDVTLSSGATTVSRAISDGNAVYTFAINNGADEYTVTVTNIAKSYTAQGSMIYYSKDGTDVEGANSKTITANGITAEMVADKTFQYGSASATIGGNVYVPLKLSTGSGVNVTFPAGKKATKVIVYGWSANGNGAINSINESETADKAIDTSDDIFYATNVAGSNYPSVYEYTLDNWESFYFNPGGSASQPFVVMDFVFEDPTPATTETITIPSDGVLTYVTENALDFSTINGAFKAYVPTSVNEAKTSVATAEVTSVPAGTALLLKGAEGSYDVEIAESATAPAANLFQVSDGSVAGGDNIFAYSKTNKKFQKVKASVTIPAGKCYLVIDGVSGDALDLDFDGEATAVDAIAEADEAEAAPVKVIKNGKLYIGNFNVAGQQVK